MNRENYFISLFKSSHIGNDGAYIDGYVYSKDAFFENIHFKSEWMSYYQIARKAMLVNISDAVAMNAKPKYALLSVAMPTKITKRNMKALSCGFKSVAKEFDIDIIGGDTISNIKLDITITIISTTKKPLLRSSAKIGDLVAYTGVLGSCEKDLKKLLRGGSIHKKSKFVNIKLEEKFVRNTARYLSTGMDISDGLFSDLAKISDASRVGYKFSKRISKLVGCSGEEYEMLVSFSPRNKKAILRQAKRSRTTLTIFAKTARVKYINRCKAHHF
ncbi:MAG: thiamine-phosphate kinase [Sulfurimonas sp.]|nr:thiamine-phosphate kinase [Sulfurimonas sp.]PHQ91916.1 MAG: thiamine-phosphate kinase [Sulfurimonas sp.]